MISVFPGGKTAIGGSVLGNRVTVNIETFKPGKYEKDETKMRQQKKMLLSDYKVVFYLPHLFLETLSQSNEERRAGAAHSIQLIGPFGRALQSHQDFDWFYLGGTKRTPDRHRCWR